MIESNIQFSEMLNIIILLSLGVIDKSHYKFGTPKDELYHVIFVVEMIFLIKNFDSFHSYFVHFYHNSL